MPLMNGDFRQTLIAVALIVSASAGGGFLVDIAAPPADVGLTKETISRLTERRKVELDQLEARFGLKLQMLEINIRKDMPPEPIRRRLRAIELKLQQMDHKWSPPTTDYRDF